MPVLPGILPCTAVRPVRARRRTDWTLGFTDSNTFPCQPTLESAAGWFFGGYAHDWFLLGGNFEADDTISPSEFNTARAISGIPNYYTTPGNLADQVRATGGCGINPVTTQRYFLPYSWNYPSAGGLLFGDVKTLLLLQITLAKQYGIGSPGVTELLKSLPKTIDTSGSGLTNHQPLGGKFGFEAV
ncbi:hypothetical protein HOY80DRAFT_33374 [Tuber brumale]|nr:hypothetical protein HOY80DRAFT_33374 [Tuber brumale]